jgi:predicted RNA binding protein YcfA (HicA-like mRNA interferase family)
MSKHDKTLARVQKKPTPADIRWEDLKSMLESMGFKYLKNSGARRKFFHEGQQTLIICHEPHPDPCVDKGCINDVVDVLKVNGFIK